MVCETLPWGILKGVRPTKIVQRFFDDGLDGEQAVQGLREKYLVSAAKARLCVEVASKQRRFLNPRGKGKNKVSVYVGIPFCPSKCLYCSFPSVISPDNQEIRKLLEALQADIVKAGELRRQFGLIVENIYIGGGTPTVLPAAELAGLLDLINKELGSSGLRELTVEAGRPDTLNEEKIDVLQRRGVGRISINPQSMQQKTLKLIGRMHTVQDIMDMFVKIRRSEIKIINMDLIVGLPGENEADIRDTMDKVLFLEPDNLTIHTLALKRGSELILRPEYYSLPPAETTGQMLAIATGRAENNSLAPYYLYRQKYMAGNFENVGYARAGTECVYNIQIMAERQTIIGIGPGAASKAVDVDTWRLNSCYNPKDVRTYINNIDYYIKRRAQLITDLFAA